MRRQVKLAAIIMVLFFSSWGAAAHAQDVTAGQNTALTMKAQVVEVLSSEDKIVPGTRSVQTYQKLNAKIVTGPESGKVVAVNNDYLNLHKGDYFYLIHTVDALDAIDAYNVLEPYRVPILYIVAAIFVACLLAFGGWQGIRGLVSLVASVLVIFYFFLPGILQGYSPVLLSISIASLIIVVGSYITHGFSRTTTTAVIGMLITIVITGLLAYWSVHAGQLSGYASEETTSLAYATKGSIDFVGLLLGGMLIGLLGVLYDAAIGQAVAVEELHRIGPHVPKRTVYKRALRMGREHIGALVNTLAIAYVGASLPLLLVYSNYISAGDVTLTLNREVIATELLRIMIGSIGLILAVPITTLVAMWIIVGKVKYSHDPAMLKKEIEALEHTSHKH